MISIFTPLSDRVAPLGAIRFLKYKDFYKNTNTHSSWNWIDTLIEAKDRTFVDWIEEITKLRLPIFPGPQIHLVTIQTPVYTPGNVPYAFFHRSIAADDLETLLYENLRIRWTCRKWIAKVRYRIMMRKRIGEIDLHTSEPIPERYCVRVFDTKHRRCYQFHVNTIHKSLQSALEYQCFAIADPHHPRNPYTNLPWSLCQMRSIVHQIQSIYWNASMKYANTWIMKFHESNYSISTFFDEWRKPLQIHAAHTFFRDSDAEYFTEIYEEVLRDMFDSLGFSTLGLVYKSILDRTIPPAIMRKWDSLVITSWIHQNHDIVIGDAYNGSYYEFETDVQTQYYKLLKLIHKDTLGQNCSS